jgi:2-aminoadipate transaminase
MTTPWNHRYAQRTQRMSSSAIRELLKLTEQADIISFAGGLPAPDVFPVEAFRQAADRVLTRRGRQALQYSTTEGYAPLREWIVEHMALYGIESRPENVLITSGSQQALDLIGKILINPGDLILTEEPTYLGALQAWRAYQAEFVTVPVDDDGLCVDQLEEALCTGPKFMYILPNFQNPSGVTMSLERRRALIEIADRYGVPIIEDDPYGELRYEGEHLPPLVVIDADRLKKQATGNGQLHDYSNGSGFMRGNVIYLSTFSKTLAPGLRLAWIVAPVEVIQHCVMGKQGMDLHTSSFVQMVAHELLRDDFLRGHVRLIRKVYRERRDVMLSALARHFPEGVTWTRPHGGLFLWVTLPERMDAKALLPAAVAHHVAYVPGDAFFPNGRGENTFRLNFSNATPEQIEEGIGRLGEVLGEELAILAEAV